jgi:hypothetical protein
MYLNNGGEPSPEGRGSPFSVLKRRLFISLVNIKISI